MKWFLSLLIFAALVFVFDLLFGGRLDAYLQEREREKRAERENSKEVKRFRAVLAKKGHYVDRHGCWTCRHLISPVWSVPPVRCRAFPDGDGIPQEILVGHIDHDHLLGNEREPVFYEPKEAADDGQTS